MSREIDPGLQIERNRLSLLLSFLRRHLTSGEYRGLLRMQRICDDRLQYHRVSNGARKAWLNEVKAEMDGLFEELESGPLTRQRLQRLAHLYRDLFLFT